MKRYIAGLAIIIILCMTAIVGCGKQRCSLCGEVKSGKTKTILGEKEFICNDCLKEIQSFTK